MQMSEQYSCRKIECHWQVFCYFRFFTDVYNREFRIDNSTALELTDNSYGYSISINEDTFSTEKSSVLCTIDISSFDPLKISADYICVSALYSVKFTSKAMKPVTLKIQHCCDDGVLQHLTFVHASKKGVF